MQNGNIEIHRQVTPGAAPPGRTVAAVVLGSAFEFYDFMLYAMFAPVIARVFFPAGNPQNSLLLALAGYGLGFLARPAGAVLIGHIADRRGRKPALLLSLGLMGAGTLLLALVPPYAVIGVAAPVLVVAARLLQGLSAGGEIGAASALLLEHGPVRRRGELMGWQIASQGMAALVATGIAMLVHLSLPAAAVESWGWRLPFLAGLLIVPVGLLLRGRLHEAPLPSPSRAPLAALLSGHRRTLLLAIGLMAGGTVQMQLTSQYLPTYLQSRLHYPPAFSYLISALVGLLLLLAPLAGRLGDGFRRRRHLLYVACGLTLLLTVPAFAALVSGPERGMAWALLPIGAMTLLYCLGTGTGLSVLLEGFPPALRATALGVAYGSGLVLFGGATPFAVAWLTDVSGSALMPAYYLMAASALSATALWFYPDRTVAETHPAEVPAFACAGELPGRQA